MSIDPDIVSALAPQGRLRVGLNMSNFLLVNAKTASGEPDGVSPDMGRMIADALGVPVEFVLFGGPGPVADAAADNVWDIANIADEPARAAVMAFSPPYAEIQANYLVPAGSTLSTPEAIDVPGVRICVKARAAYELWLSDNLKHATLQRFTTVEEAFDAFNDGAFDALACLRPKLLDEQARFPGATMVEPAFTAVKQCVGSRHGAPRASAWIADFVSNVVASGESARLIAKHEVPGLSVPAI